MKSWRTYLRRLLLCTLSAAVMAPQPALAAERVELERQGKWLLTYDENTCSLRNRFGPADKSVFLELRQFKPGTEFWVTVATADYRISSLQYRARFEPGIALDEGAGTALEFGDGLKGVTFPLSIVDDNFRALQNDALERGEALPVLTGDALTARESAITGLLVEHQFSSDLLFDLDKFAPLTQSMATCMDDLVTHWGFNAEAQKHLQRGPTFVNLAQMAGRVQANYPQQMVMKGEQALVRIRMDVSSEGLPSGCHPLLVISNPAFEETACQILMRGARFEPAINAAGEPIASYYVLSIVYALR